MSFIHYKFKAARDYDSVVVDGMGLSVFDLKREIIVQKKLKSDDFDLVLTNAESNEDYTDDAAVVPRNSALLIRRIPIPDAKKRGIIAGAAKYLADGKDALSASTTLNSLSSSNSTFANGGNNGVDMGSHRQRFPPFAARPRHAGAADAVVPLVPVHSSQFTINRVGNGIPGLSHVSSGGIPGLDAIASNSDLTNGFSMGTVEGAYDGLSSIQDDELRMQAMLQENSQYWEATQEKMAGMRKIQFQPTNTGTRPSFRPRNDSAPVRDPPPGYVCHRCGQKGHFIQDCPTNGNTTFDRPKVKRTTGIPRSFLKEVDDPELSLKNRGAEGTGPGVMVTKDGKVVQVMSNDAAWRKIQNTMGAAVSSEDALMEDIPAMPEYACPLCNKTLKEAVEISCCYRNFCDDCIRTSLTEDGPVQFTCPACRTHPMVPDNLQPNYALRMAIEKHVREHIAKRISESQQLQPLSQPQSEPIVAKFESVPPTLQSRVTERNNAVPTVTASKVRVHAPVGHPPMTLPGVNNNISNGNNREDLTNTYREDMVTAKIQAIQKAAGIVSDPYSNLQQQQQHPQQQRQSTHVMPLSLPTYYPPHVRPPGAYPMQTYSAGYDPYYNPGMSMQYSYQQPGYMRPQVYYPQQQDLMYAGVQPMPMGAYGPVYGRRPPSYPQMSMQGRPMMMGRPPIRVYQPRPPYAVRPMPPSDTVNQVPPEENTIATGQKRTASPDENEENNSKRLAL